VSPEAALEVYLHAHIPLSRAMGVRVVEASAARVRLAAPLAPNLNHRRTAFGGSIASLATLAGWGWLHVQLAHHRPPVRLVVQKSALEYLEAIDDDFEAVCEAPAAEQRERFERMLAQKGRSRLELAVAVLAHGRTCATLAGTFAAAVAPG
jgi:thioesterase domain-containing protein